MAELFLYRYVEIGMGQIFVRLIAFACSLTLALPPGSCLQLAATSGSEAKVPSCCQHQFPHARTGAACPQPPAPAPCKLSCCCARDAVLIERTVKLADQASDGFSLLPAAILSADGGCVSLAGAAPFYRPPGPRLQILFCVWRC